MTHPSDRGLHLVEPGLRWLPETFLRWKLQRLAERGFRVTVVSEVPRRENVPLLPGIGLKRVPPWDQGTARKVLAASAGSAVLFAQDRRRLATLVDGVRRPLVPPRRRGPLRDVRRLRSYLPVARLRPDVVHFEWESAAVHHLPLYDVWGCPVVVSCHGSGLELHPHIGYADHWVRGYETVFRKAAAVVCVCAAQARDAVRYGAEPRKTHVIRPAVDLSYFRPGPARSGVDELRIAAVGNLLWVKGHEYALEALRALLDAGVPARLDILGGDPDPDTGEHSQRPKLLYAIHDLGLDGRARLHGEVSQAEVRARLHDADVLLHPSLSEGIPTVVLEAMACGLPVVVTDCGGMREAVTDGVEGLVVARRDPGAMARALLTLWRDAELRRRLGAAGRARVEAEFDVDRQVDRFAELYRSLVRDGQSPTAARVLATTAR